jgi:Malate synthase G, alpha-beta insertion domain
MAFNATGLSLSSHFEALEDRMSAKAGYLDLMVPLVGASHAEAIDYAIVIPMRYAECFALLADGRRVRMREPQQLVGWSGPVERRTFVFRNGDRGIEIRVNAARRRRIREVQAFLLSIRRSLEFGMERVRKLTARDGSLVFVGEQCRTIIDRATERTCYQDAGAGNRQGHSRVRLPERGELSDAAS